jgi:hypothetical protein
MGGKTFSRGKALVMPIALMPLATKSTAQAFIVCTNGNVHAVVLNGSQAIRAAQKEAVEFNAMVKAQGGI